MKFTTINGKRQKVDGQEISWAGSSPWTENLCYGTDQGDLVFAYPTKTGSETPLKGLNLLDDSVNGVAFSSGFVAVSSRNSMALVRRIEDGQLARIKPFEKLGVYQIVSRPHGGFIAAAGVEGLLLINVDGNEVEYVLVALDAEQPNFYRLASLPTVEGKEFFACAARSSGLFAITFKDGVVRTPVTCRRFKGIDLIDVCSLKSSNAHHAIAALNEDGTLFLSKDLLKCEEILTLNIPALKGVAYTILSAQGHVIVLTDVCMVIIPNLVNAFLSGDRMTEDMPMIVVSIQASEIFLANDETLIALVDGNAIAYRIADLVNILLNPHVENRADDLRDNVNQVTIESTFFRPIIVSHTDWQTSALHPSPSAA